MHLLTDLKKCIKYKMDPIQSFACSTLLLLGGYFGMLAFSKSIQSIRQQSWILTLISSAVMVAGGLFSFVSFGLHSGFRIAAHPTEFSDWDVWLCCFFAAYLMLDLIVGILHYREQMTVLSGYIHHLGYLWLLVHLVHQRLVTPFCLMAILELPTFILALGHIWKFLRHDLLFGFTYFLTRVAYHGYMIHEFYHYFHLDDWWMVIAAIYPLHLYWFSGWIKRMYRIIYCSTDNTHSFNQQSLPNYDTLFDSANFKKKE